MRIITGATQRSSTQAVYGELGWHTLAQRRTIHRLKLFYKIKYNIAPSYLSQLMPQTAHERNPYVLRNREDLTPFRTRRQVYYKSFFPNTTRDWNSLPLEIRQAPTLCSFNRMLGAHFSPPPRRAWYGCGKRVLDIYHTRLRLGCSGLKAHLHFNLHVEDDPYCRCRRVIEDPAPYLLHFPFPWTAHTSLTWDNTNSYSLIRYNLIWWRDFVNQWQYSHFPIGSNIYWNNKTVQIMSLVCTDHITSLVTIVTHSFTHLNVHVCSCLYPRLVPCSS